MLNSLFIRPRTRRSIVVLLLAVLLSACAAGTHHRKGMHALYDEQYVDAMLHLEQAAKLEPGNIDYRRDWLTQRDAVIVRLLEAGEKAAGEGKRKEAEQNFNNILKFDPNNSRAKSGLADLDEAQRAGNDVERARESLKKGNSVDAARWAERALERNPALPSARAIQREILAARSQDMQVNPSLAGLYKKPVNLEFRDASLKMVFDALSRTTGINFIFDRDVKTEQRTTVLIKQTPLEDAVDVVLSTNQLEKKVLNASSVLIYPNTPAKLKEHQDLLVRAFYLKNIDAKTGANILKTVLKIKDVYVDEKYHMLVLRESAETIELAEKLIALQDLEEPEVMLEVEVLEVNRNRLLNLGIQLTNQLTVSPLGVTPGGGSSTGGSTASTYKLSDLLNLSSDKLGVTVPSATISFSKTDGDANLLANPRLRVRDRDKARILIGDKIPVVTTTTTPNGFLSENVQYLDVGLKLEVEPEIHLHDEIGLKLSLEVSSLVGSIKTATGTQAYQIGTRNVTSSLRLKDGETQVLAGLISDADRSDGNRIPLLGDVPLLGRLFSSQKDDRQKTEIVMSITPRLVRNIQRRAPSAETFWSGTESSLRTKPVQLTMLNPAAAPAETSAVQSMGQKLQAPVADTSGIRLSWKAPQQARVGQVFQVDLTIDSDHLLRAAPLQLAYDPAVFDVVAVRGGEFFDKGGKGQFNAVTDKASGRISVGVANGEGPGSKGQGRILSLELRPVAPSAEAALSIVSLTPVGQVQAVSPPTALAPVTLVVEK